MKPIWTVICAILLAMPSWVLADKSIESSATPQFEEGRHYVRLSQPVRTRDSSKIEVVEVFWYGCPHCFHLEPLVDAWLARQPEDVDFWRSPAMWNDTMRTHARAFYTASALGVLDRLHEPIFEAINLQGRALANQAQLRQLFVDHGVDAADFDKAYSSFGVDAQVRQADARARSYQIRGTPELIVNGTWRVSAGLAGDQGTMLDVVDFLVDKVRRQRAGS